MKKTDIRRKNPIDLEKLTFNVNVSEQDDKTIEEFTFYYKEVCVGTATVTYWKENNTRRDIYSFNINENYRRKGFGKAAVEKLREYERKQGCKKLVLESDRCVVRFWSKCGFEQCCDDNFGSWGIWMYRDI